MNDHLLTGAIPVRFDTGGLILPVVLSKSHIDFICHKISKSIGIIAKLRHYILRQLLLSTYHTLITPYLTYGISAWGYCAKTHLNRLLILQKRALRFNCLLQVSRTCNSPIY